MSRKKLVIMGYGKNYPVKFETTLRGPVNKSSNFANFVKFRPHTHPCNQQFLPPLMGGNYVIEKLTTFGTLAIAIMT